MTAAMTTYEALGWASIFATVPENTTYYGVGGAAGNSDPGAATQRYLIDSGSLQKRGVILARDALRGTREENADDTRVGPYTVAGTIDLRPTPEDLAVWFPRILGATASGTSYALAETLKEFKVWQQLIAKITTYRGCKVDKATFRFRKGDFMRVSLDIVGATETVVANDTFATLTGSVTTPFIICDGVLTLQGAARTFDDCEIVINNNLYKDNFKNSCTIVSLDEGPRVITVKTSHAYNTTNVDLYNQALAGAGGTLVLTLGNYSLTFTFGTLQVPDETPMIKGKDDIPLVLNMVARKTGSTASLAVTLDSTG